MNSSQLIPYLEELRGRPLFFQPNPGNAGDALIAVATLDLFKRLGLKVKMFSPASIPLPAGAVLVHTGGGGFWGDNRVVIDFLRTWAPRASRVVLLPQTITGHEQLLADLPEHVHLFCRERVSYDYLQGLPLKAQVFLDHDVALYLPARQWLARFGPLRLLLLTPSRGFKGLRRYRAAIRAHPGATTLAAWRGDDEARDLSRRQRVARAADVSRNFSLGWRRRRFLIASAWFWLKFIDRYTHVQTDRLHVGIGAALLGKSVHLHPNRYFKNRAVYEHSLKHSFPNVHWAGDPQ